MNLCGFEAGTSGFQSLGSVDGAEHHGRAPTSPGTAAMFSTGRVRQPSPPVGAGYPSLSLSFAMATTATSPAVATIPMRAASPTTPTMATVLLPGCAAAGAGDGCATGAGAGVG